MHGMGHHMGLVADGVQLHPDRQAGLGALDGRVELLAAQGSAS